MHIKKLILLLFLVPVLAQAQKTTGPNYTYIAQRYEWLAGVFKALGIPAGDSAQFQTGQEMRAGAMYYDSVGVDSGLYVWSGLAWNVAGTSYTDADARAAISLTTTGTSGAATYSSATGVFNIPVYAGTLNANAGAFYRWLIPSTQEIKTFAPGYGFLLDSASNADAITAILDTGTVFPDIRATIEPNLIVDSIGVTGTEVIVARNDSLLHRLITTGINYILVDTLSTGEIRIRLDTASATLKAYIAANAPGGGTYTTTDNNLDITGTVISTQKTVQTLTDGATITWDMSTGYNAEVTLGGNRTLDITDIQEGDYGTITVFQDGTGGRTLTVPGGTITLNSAASDSTVLSFYYDGNSYAWRDGSKIILFRAVTWVSPTSSDNITVYKTDVAITVSKVTAVVVGTSPSVTYQINFASDRSSGSPTTLFSAGQVTTSTTTGDEDTTFADATIPAGSYIWITTSAASGTITEMNVTIKYTND